MRTKTIGSNEYHIGEQTSMESCFSFGIDMADELIDSMKIKGGYSFDRETLWVIITKDNKTHRFIYPYMSWVWWEGIYCIDKAINEIDPSINAHFSSRGGYDDEEDTITLTVN